MNPAITPAPTLGRIVNFTCDTNAATKLNQVGGRKYNIGDVVPGMVTYPLENRAANLKLFPDGTDECLHLSGVPYSSGSQPGTWSWPAQTEAVAEAA